MELGLVVGIIGTIISISSFIYAIVVAKRSKKIKDLIYDRLPPAPIAGAISRESGYSIKIVYEGSSRTTESVESVYVQYLRFTNFGQVPIANSDLAASDPLRIEITGGKVLDIALASVTRDVCQISLGQVSNSNGKIVANVSFDFLDKLDGGLIQIVTEGESAHVSFKGTVIGMPQGLVEGKNSKSSIIFPDLGCILPIIIQIAALISVPFVYRQLNGSWEDIWLLLIPVAALVLPLALTIPPILLFQSKERIKFPKHLEPPNWYESRLFLYDDPTLAKRRMEMQRNIERNKTDATYRLVQ